MAKTSSKDTEATKESSVELSKLQNTSVEEKKETLIYCGPTSKYAKQFSSFIGGYPDNMKVHMEKCGVLKGLFVKVEDFPSFNKKLKDNSSIESAMYSQAVEYFKKGV